MENRYMEEAEIRKCAFKERNITIIPWKYYSSISYRPGSLVSCARQPSCYL